MLTIKETVKRSKILTDNSVLCKCGHKTPIPYYIDRMVCSWCNHYVYRTPELEEKYKEEQNKKDFMKNMKGILNEKDR